VESYARGFLTLAPGLLRTADRPHDARVIHRPSERSKNATHYALFLRALICVTSCRDPRSDVCDDMNETHLHPHRRIRVNAVNAKAMTRR
jgi:hypothetical protein